MRERKKKKKKQAISLSHQRRGPGHSPFLEKENKNMLMGCHFSQVILAWWFLVFLFSPSFELKTT